MRTKACVFSAQSIVALQSDVAQLIHEFQQSDEVTFARFKSCWKEMKFSLIHLTRSPEEDLQPFMYKLYAAVLFEMQEADIKGCIAGLFGLYCLYHTNKAGDPVHIPMPISMWRRLKSIRSEAEDMQCSDFGWVLTALHTATAFSFCADVQLGGVYLSSIAQHPSAPTDRRLESHQARVEELRREVLSLPHTTPESLLDLGLVDLLTKLYQTCRHKIAFDDDSQPGGLPAPLMKLRRLKWMAQQTPRGSFEAPVQSDDTGFITAVNNHLTALAELPTDASFTTIAPVEVPRVLGRKRRISKRPTQPRKRQGRPPNRLTLPVPNIAEVPTEQGTDTGTGNQREGGD